MFRMSFVGFSIFVYVCEFPKRKQKKERLKCRGKYRATEHMGCCHVSYSSPWVAPYSYFGRLIFNFICRYISFLVFVFVFVAVSTMNTDNISTQMTAIARVSFWIERAKFAERCTCKVKRNETNCFLFGFFLLLFELSLSLSLGFYLLSLNRFNGGYVLYVQWCAQTFCHQKKKKYKQTTKQTLIYFLFSLHIKNNLWVLTRTRVVRVCTLQIHIVHLLPISSIWRKKKITKIILDFGANWNRHNC